MSAHSRKLVNMTCVIVNGSFSLFKVVNYTDNSMESIDEIVIVIYVSYIISTGCIDCCGYRHY